MSKEIVNPDSETQAPSQEEGRGIFQENPGALGADLAHLSWPPPANQGLPLEDLFGGQVDAGAGCSSDPFASTL